MIDTREAMAKGDLGVEGAGARGLMYRSECRRQASQAYCGFVNRVRLVDKQCCGRGWSTGGEGEGYMHPGVGGSTVRVL
jgi:hypothetical protein